MYNADGRIERAIMRKEIEMNSKITAFILFFIILFMGLNIYAENNKVILKKFEVRSKSNNFNSEKY
ncbi:MAG: hypothetical protein J7L71_03240, partial [Spirochaetaceae bacterium]|nr:hypothetical protein [Spirochaetaceae bacterium]